MIQYYIITVIMLGIMLYFTAYRNRERSKKFGFLSWILLILYFPIEALVTSRTTSTYSSINQAMSDLGVTECMAHAYALAPYHICSPLSGLMNVTFIITGILIASGAILLHRFWRDGQKTGTATAMWVIYGLGYSVSGIYPADINFWVHTIFSLPSMFLHIPAMIIIARAIKPEMPGLAKFTYICMGLSAFSLLVLFVGFAPGLMQRLLYGFVWIWMSVTAIILWKRENEGQNQRNTAGD
ncbi:DUF998 domain-containing protein [Salinicoccus sp. HZC-1]|uniref:DUF998 domain-containing protein n=1 Tax=Salinicoccus sp. HZC-1 TaxID=3385497 RepID=UPI00398AE9B4